MQPLSPTTRMIAFGDDLYEGDHRSRLYRAASIKEAACLRLGHRARKDKELCFSPASEMEHAPASMPGSPRHHAGRLDGFKGVGCYFGKRDWVRAQLTTKAQKLYRPLDRVDAMCDCGDVENSAQIRLGLLQQVAVSRSTYWLRSQRPTLTTVPPSRPDGLPQLDADGMPCESMAAYSTSTGGLPSPLRRWLQPVTHRPSGGLVQCSKLGCLCA